MLSTCDGRHISSTVQNLPLIGSASQIFEANYNEVIYTLGSMGMSTKDRSL